jgi:hypothetical protein
MFRKISYLKLNFVFQIIFVFFISYNAKAGIVGDIDNDGKIGLKEAIYALQVVAGIKEQPLPSISGYLQHNGISMSQFTDVNPVIWFRNEDTGQAYDATATYSNADGSYEIRNLTGRTGISVSFHVIGSSKTLPGNYRKWMTIDTDTITDYNITIELEKIIHLIQPWDNNNFIDLMPPYPEHNSQIIFEWEPITGSTSYRIFIGKYRDSEHPEGYGNLGTVLLEYIQSSKYFINLEPSNQYEHYEFNVRAFNDFGRNGLYMTTYNGGHGWDYRFKIVN